MKTFVPGAVDVASAAHKYMTRHQTKLVSDKTTEQVTALLDLIACLAAFLSKWNKPPIQP